MDNKDLYTALAKAQAEMDMAGKTNTNPHFKYRYADLSEIIKASRPALTKNNLAVIQKISHDDQGRIFLISRICHSSGQFEESVMPIFTPMNDMQKFGSALSYARRYSYAALVGVVTGDEDDDGEAAVLEVRRVGNGYEHLTKDQHDELQYHLQEHPDIAEAILKKFNVKMLSQLPRNEYRTIMSRVLEIKETKKLKQ